MQKVFLVRALWDEDVRRYYSETDIDGLAIETDTLDEFEAVMNEYAGELILANHRSREDILSATLMELVPIVVWQRPAPHNE